MAFDPLSWAIGYTLKKGLDHLLADKSLSANLQNEFSKWAKNLPPEAHIFPDSDFAVITPDADPVKKPSLCALRDTLLDNHIPTESQWLDALLEQWRLVPGAVEEPQKFFKLPEDTAQKHLAVLAKALSDECAKYDSLFKPGAIDLLRKANGKLDTIDGKVDVLLERVKPEPIPQGPTQNHDLQIHINPTRDRQHQLAQIMVLNTGQRPILLDAWSAFWADSGIVSACCVRGTLPVRLQDHERADLLVDISSHPVEQLQNLGVLDAEKRFWHANAEELRQFINVAKLYQPSKIDSTAQQKTIEQNDNKGNIGGGDIHTGIDLEVLNAALKVLYKCLERVDTDQSNKLVSELKELSDENLNTQTVLTQDKYNNEQKLYLEKEFQLYGELWKALIDVRSSIIITPTLDRTPKGKLLYDVYKDRYDIAVDAFNKANNLFENNRPFYHDDISKITIYILIQCRGYINRVSKMLRSGSFDDELHDIADELLEIIPKAIDEIEKAIKRRIGLGN